MQNPPADDGDRLAAAPSPNPSDGDDENMMHHDANDGDHPELPPEDNEAWIESVSKAQ